MSRRFAAQSWVVWLISISVITLVTRNPFYLIILLLIARVVESTCFVTSTRVKIHFWRLAAIIMMGSILFNLLMVRVGGTILFNLPQNWWLIGGPKTLEAAIYGAINGLTLITLLAIFLTFNAVVPVSDLIKLIPKAMTNLGIILLLALTYVPETISHLRRIREAQAIRGHRLRGFRDWQPIVIPLLIGGLERSLSLAESMISRGFSSTVNVRQPVSNQLVMLSGLVLTFAGWIITFQNMILGIILLIIGVMVIVGLFFWTGRRIRRSQYRPRPWVWSDWAVIICSLFAIVIIFIPLSFVDSSTIFYTPYPQATLPAIDVMIGIALSFLAVPIILVEI